MRQVLILLFFLKKIDAVREAEGGRRGGREKKRELARESAREMLYRTRNTVQLLAPTQGSWWSSARVCFLVVAPCSLDIFYADVRSEIISINLFCFLRSKYVHNSQLEPPRPAVHAAAAVWQRRAVNRRLKDVGNQVHPVSVGHLP